jgi:hypothetical protein
MAIAAGFDQSCLVSFAIVLALPLGYFLKAMIVAWFASAVNRRPARSNVQGGCTVPAATDDSARRSGGRENCPSHD